MPAATITTLTVDGVALTVQVVRAPVTHVNARLRGAQLRISAPQALPQRDLDDIVRDLARKLLRRRRSREVTRDGRLVALAEEVAARFPHPPAVAAVRFSTTQVARWGSFSPTSGTIRLHAALAAMPTWVLEAVMAHELAHTVHRHHSPAFWALVRSVCPQTDRARAFLAGVSWLARRWPTMSPAERDQLAGSSCPADSDADE